MDKYTATEQAYKNGYEKGYAAGKPKWIPVSERLPEEGKEVLALCWHHESWQPHVCYLSENLHGRWITSIAGQWMIHVSHWMALPEPPKEGV